VVVDTDAEAGVGSAHVLAEDSGSDSEISDDVVDIRSRVSSIGLLEEVNLFSHDPHDDHKSASAPVAVAVAMARSFELPGDDEDEDEGEDDDEGFESEGRNSSRHSRHGVDNGSDADSAVHVDITPVHPQNTTHS
jgi:hypothetical protein